MNNEQKNNMDKGNFSNQKLNIMENIHKKEQMEEVKFENINQIFLSTYSVLNKIFDRVDIERNKNRNIEALNCYYGDYQLSIFTNKKSQKKNMFYLELSKNDEVIPIEYLKNIINVFPEQGLYGIKTKNIESLATWSSDFIVTREAIDTKRKIDDFL